MHPEIIPYEENYRSQLISLWERSVLATHDFLKPEDFLSISNIVKSLDFTQLPVFCLVKNKKLIGFLGISGRKVEMLFIDPDFAGQGAGKMLMKFAIQKLQADQVDVNEQNTRAVSFYTKLGFTTLSRSETDSQGLPYPILNMHLSGEKLDTGPEAI